MIFAMSDVTCSKPLAGFRQANMSTCIVDPGTPTQWAKYSKVTVSFFKQTPFTDAACTKPAEWGSIEVAYQPVNMCYTPALFPGVSVQEQCLDGNGNSKVTP